MRSRCTAPSHLSDRERSVGMGVLVRGLVTAAGLLASTAGAPAWGHLPAATSEVTVSRVAGVDRYATAAALHTWAVEARGGLGAEGVALFTLATGEDWPDALAASGLGTVLLVHADAVPDPTAARIAASLEGVRDVYLRIVGGEEVVSAATEQALVRLVADAAPSATVHVNRYSGADRYETAASLAFDAAPGEASGIYGVELVSGEAFPDAAVAAPLGGAILLTKRDVLPAATTQALEGNVQATDIIGGTSVVSEAVAEQVSKVSILGERIAGPNRFETAAQVAREVEARWPQFPVEVAFVVGSDAWPDAIAASGAARFGNRVVLYTTPGCVPTATRESLNEIAPEQIVIVGGPSVAYYGPNTC